MATVKQIADRIGISRSQLRLWTKEFSDFLSPGATPAPGQTRNYNDDDLAILTTIKVLRDNGQPYPTIHEELASGRRVEPLPDEPEEDTEQEQIETVTTALVRYENKIDDLTERLIEAERAKGEAETRAAVAEKELEIMRALIDQEGKKRPWWRFWD